MNESKTYVWQGGFYSLQDMIILVKYRNLTSEDFYKVTKIHYEDIIKKMGDTN